MVHGAHRAESRNALLPSVGGYETDAQSSKSAAGKHAVKLQEKHEQESCN